MGNGPTISQVTGVWLITDKSWLYSINIIAFGNEFVVMIGGGVGRLTTMLRACVSCPSPFSALRVNMNVPTAVGVPLIVLPESVRPDGRLPLAIVHAMGVSPSAVSVWL